MTDHPQHKTAEELGPIEHALNEAARAAGGEPDAGFEARLLAGAPLGEASRPTVFARIGRGSGSGSEAGAWLGSARFRVAAGVGLALTAGLLAWGVLQGGAALTDPDPRAVALEAELDAWLAMGEALALPYRTELAALGAEADALFTLHTDPAAWAGEWASDWPWMEAGDDSPV
ncbi:MAG: hypothetical protein EA378_11210 [Phycisphaerales bacterium]|nr:MAG: hypothetical protein EA378_11210 [Phycisphaerales bacterium]